MKEQKSNILLIYTGGTIGMIENPQDGTLQNFQLDQLLLYLPEMTQVGCAIDSYAFTPPIDSSDMEPKVWIKLVEVIANQYHQYDGFVILHGTDTMAYTASALSFMLGNLTKPVIFTGSQLPIGALRTDGKENLLTSIEIASNKIHHHAVVPEVCILFENRLMRGNRTTKIAAENFKAFQSFNYPDLAHCGIHIRYSHEYILPCYKHKPLHPYLNIDENVVILKLFTGIQKYIVDAILNIPQLKGVILESFGAGNAPQKDWLIQSLAKANQNGIVIVNITQCAQGSVMMGRYANGYQLYQAGVISGKDMTTESALTKLMHLLGQGYNHEEIKRLIKKPIAGEISHT